MLVDSGKPGLDGLECFGGYPLVVVETGKNFIDDLAVGFRLLGRLVKMPGGGILLALGKAGELGGDVVKLAVEVVPPRIGRGVAGRRVAIGWRSPGEEASRPVRE